MKRNYEAEKVYSEEDLAKYKNKIEDLQNKLREEQTKRANYAMEAAQLSRELKKAKDTIWIKIEEAYTKGIESTYSKTKAISRDKWFEEQRIKYNRLPAL